MKQLLLLRRTLAPLAVVLLFSGCLKDKVMKTYTYAVPVFQVKEVVLENIRSGSPEELRHPGKLFIQGRYLFINELGKGVHVIDNGDPRVPVPVAFINIPGNVDLAVKGNYLYADMHSTLVVLDIVDPLNVKLVKYIDGVFPERNYEGTYAADPTHVIVDWLVRDTTVDASSDFPGSCRNCVFEFNRAVPQSFLSNDKSGTGIGGSMARFTIVGDYLYTVGTEKLRPFNISRPQEPGARPEINIGDRIETIYPFKDKLFIGSAVGMFIYDIKNPEQPKAEGSFVHATACDPVVADDTHAYVTLRTGTGCVGSSNQLDVVSIENIKSPKLAKTYPLANPHGLAKDGDLLFICDGHDGVKVYNAKNVYGLLLLKHIEGLNTYDVIAWNNKLLVVATDGLYQYDYSSIPDIKLISKLAVTPIEY